MNRYEKTIIAAAVICFALAVALSGCAPVEVEPPPSPTYGVCEVDVDCEVDVCVAELEDGEALPGGLCTSDCATDRDCVDGGTCLNYNPTDEQYCFPPCDEDLTCRDGWACVQFLRPVCIPEWLF